MALPKQYSDGAASIVNGETAVTGTGTAWANIVTADDVFRVQGFSVRIASVESNGALTLAEPWPGTTLDDDPYEIAVRYDGPEFQLRLRQMIEGLGQVSSTGIGIDAFGPFSGRTTYDDEAEGFAFLSTNGDGDAITTPVVFI